MDKLGSKFPKSSIFGRGDNLQKGHTMPTPNSVITGATNEKEHQRYTPTLTTSQSRLMHSHRPARCDSNAGTACPLGAGGGGNAHREDDVDNPTPASPRSTPEAPIRPRSSAALLLMPSPPPPLAFFDVTGSPLPLRCELSPPRAAAGGTFSRIALGLLDRSS